MNRLLFFIFILVSGILLWSGIHSIRLIEKKNEELKTWEQDSIKHNAILKDQKRIVKNIVPNVNSIKAQAANAKSSLSNPYLSASQGVEVHLEGIRWSGKWFKPNLDRGISKLGGISEIQKNQILFDPDFAKSGFPDLNIEVTSPRFFEMKSFLKDWLDGFSLSGLLGKVFEKAKPIESIQLETVSGKKRNMTLWLLEYDMFIRVDPFDSHDDSNEGNLDKHPVSGKKTNELRKEREWKNQRYDNVSLMLKFKPKKGSWFIAKEDTTGMLIPNGEPEIGISSVECIGIKPIGEDNNNNRIGVYLRKGSSFALYNDPQEIDQKFVGDGININDVLTNTPLEPDFEGEVSNPDFFGKSKFSILHMNNIGSWKEGSWLSSRNKFADQYHAKFVIQVYELGEWLVKPFNIVKPEPRPPFSVRTPGFLDFVLPDFGIFGKLLSGTGWTVLLVILISVLFPPAGLVINGFIKILLKRIGI